MLIECWAIVVVITGIFVIYMRTGRKVIAFMSLPLVIVPLGYIVSGPVSLAVYSMFAVNPINTCIIFNVVALVSSCVLFRGLMVNLRTKRGRALYFFVCSGFTLVLSLVLIFRDLLPRV